MLRCFAPSVARFARQLAPVVSPVAWGSAPCGATAWASRGAAGPAESKAPAAVTATVGSASGVTGTRPGVTGTGGGGPTAGTTIEGFKVRLGEWRTELAEFRSRGLDPTVVESGEVFFPLLDRAIFRNDLDSCVAMSRLYEEKVRPLRGVDETSMEYFLEREQEDELLMKKIGDDPCRPCRLHRTRLWCGASNACRTQHHAVQSTGVTTLAFPVRREMFVEGVGCSAGRFAAVLRRCSVDAAYAGSYTVLAWRPPGKQPLPPHAQPQAEHRKRSFAWAAAAPPQPP